MKKNTSKQIELNGVKINIKDNKILSFELPKGFSGFEYQRWREKNKNQIKLLIDPDFNAELEDMEKLITNNETES